MILFCIIMTAAVAKWLERPPRERDVVSLISGRGRPKSLKAGSSGFPPCHIGLWE